MEANPTHQNYLKATHSAMLTAPPPSGYSPNQTQPTKLATKYVLKYLLVEGMRIVFRVLYHNTFCSAVTCKESW